MEASENLTIEEREQRTRQSVLEAEDRRWECEYRLSENENGRLRAEVNILKNELETMNQDLTSTALF